MSFKDPEKQRQANRRHAATGEARESARTRKSRERHRRLRAETFWKYKLFHNQHRPGFLEGISQDLIDQAEAKIRAQLEETTIVE